MRDTLRWRRGVSGNELRPATVCVRMKGALIGGKRVHGGTRIYHAASLNGHISALRLKRPSVTSEIPLPRVGQLQIYW